VVIGKNTAAIAALTATVISALPMPFFTPRTRLFSVNIWHFYTLPIR